MKVMLMIMIFLLCFSVSADASQTMQDYYDTVLDAAGSDAERFLRDIGIENGNVDEMINIEFQNVVNQLLKICRNEMKAPLNTALSVLVLLFILSVVRTLLSSYSELSEILSYVGTVMAAFLVLVPLSQLIADIVSVSAATHDYMKILIPVYGGIVTATGKPTLAFCLQGSVFATAQMLASFIRTSFPVAGVIFTTLSVCSCLSGDIKTDHIAQLFKKAYIGMLTFCSVVFSSVLSVKSVLASSADTIAVKGIKFIIGNAVPVVGGALADSLNTVISGVALLKSTIGILSVVLLLAINLPTLTELLMWTFALKLLSAVSALTGQNTEDKLFDSLSGVFTIFNAAVIYQAFLYIISVSIIAVVAGMKT